MDEVAYEFLDHLVPGWVARFAADDKARTVIVNNRVRSNWFPKRALKCFLPLESVFDWRQRVALNDTCSSRVYLCSTRPQQVSAATLLTIDPDLRTLEFLPYPVHCGT